MSNIIKSSRPFLDPNSITIDVFNEENLKLSALTFNVTNEIRQLFDEYSKCITDLTYSSTDNDNTSVNLTRKDNLYTKINRYTKTIRFYDYTPISTEISNIKTAAEAIIDPIYFIGRITKSNDDKTVDMGSLPKFNEKVGLLESYGLISDIFANSDAGYVSFNEDSTREFELTPCVNGTLNRNYIVSGKNITEVIKRKSNALTWFRDTWDTDILDTRKYNENKTGKDNYQNTFIDKTTPTEEIGSNINTSGDITSKPFYFIKCNDDHIDYINITLIARCFPIVMEKRKLAPNMWIFSYPEWIMNRKDIIKSIQPNAYLELKNDATIISLYETKRTTFGLLEDEGEIRTIESDKIANCNLVKVGGQ